MYKRQLSMSYIDSPTSVASQPLEAAGDLTSTAEMEEPCPGAVLLPVSPDPWSANSIGQTGTIKRVLIMMITRTRTLNWLGKYRRDAIIIFLSPYTTFLVLSSRPSPVCPPRNTCSLNKCSKITTRGPTQRQQPRQNILLSLIHI